MDQKGAGARDAIDANLTLTMNSRKSSNRISIGILAYNSATTIQSTIRGLVDQDFISEEQPDCLVEIIVLPNGCSDDTSELATETLDGVHLASHVTFRICDIKRKGKCNAWNEFVHEFSDPDADILVFMDSDISFLDTHTLKNLVDAVAESETARIAVDKPIKDVALKDNRTWWEWLSLQITDVGRKSTPSICGQLYAGTSKHLRQIWMPTALPVEDGFLRAMILTNGFREAEDFSRIIKAENASHRFEAHLGTKNLLSHEEWLVAASTINTFVYDFLWKRCRDGKCAGELIRELNKDPNWVDKLVADKIRYKFWVVPSRFLFRRFHQMRRFPFFKALRKSPIVLIAFFVDCIICFRVNRTIKRNKGVGYWRTDSNPLEPTVRPIAVPTSNRSDEVHVS